MNRPGPCQVSPSDLYFLSHPLDLSAILPAGRIQKPPFRSKAPAILHNSSCSVYHPASAPESLNPVHVIPLH